MTIKGIYSKRCWVEGSLQEATVFFAAGLITAIEKGARNDFEGIEDAGDAVVMPGVIDAHVHVNEPGRTEWEGFETATAAAAAGGTTTIVDMPLNASPVTTSVEAFAKKLQASKGKLAVNCGFYGGLVPGNINEIEGLWRAGVLGIKVFLTHSGIDEFPNVEESDLEGAMPLLARLGVPLLAHCELSDEQHSALLAKNPKSYQAYLASRPSDWEDRAVEMMIRLCRKHCCPVHIVHVSSASSLAAIEAAKVEGLPLTAETCPHYLFFNAETIPDTRTIYKCAPPIREEGNNQQLKEAFETGILDFIASDHSPAPPEIKELETGNFQKAWGGIAGLQLLLSASWTSFKDSLGIAKFIPLLTEGPAQFLQVSNRKGFLKEGYDADITVWAPEEKFVVDETDIFHRHKASPYVGETLWGVIQQTYVGGELVYTKGEITNKNCGKWLLRK